MKDDPDPIIKEIPVFVSKQLQDQLHIIQYPMKPFSEGYDNATILKAMVKPENQEIMMKIAIETHDSHYNLNKGLAIAANAEPTSKRDAEEEKMFDSDYMDKVTLTSLRSLPNCDNYAIGVFQDKELYLTPVKSIVQMRPQFNYLEKNDKRTKDDGRNNDDEGEEEEEQAQQVNVTFARQVPDFIKKMREQSFQTHSKKISEEEWIPVCYQKTSSSSAELAKMQMSSCVNEDSVNNLELTKSQYLKILAPPLKEEQYSKANIPTYTTSLSYIRTLPLLDQIRTLMKDAKVLSFEQLRSIISNEHETSAILKYLQQVAVLVQGNWIVNSELIYPKDNVSAHSGIPSELMCRARDYILLSFTDHEFVDRRAISSVVKLPTEEIKDIFTNIAKHQPKKGWRLIVPPNKNFNDRYPEIAQRQEMTWEAKRKHLREAMENHGPQRHRRKSNRESFSSENEDAEKSKSHSRSQPKGSKQT